MTYASDSAKRRERRPSLCMAKKPTVIGIIGKTHGVRFSASPPTKRMSSVNGKPCSAYAAESLSLTTGVASFGAADRGVKFVPPAGNTFGATTVVLSMVTSASRGGRQTLSLHD